MHDLRNMVILLAVFLLLVGQSGRDVADLLPTTIDAYTRQNRYAEAEAALGKAVELDPRNAEHQTDLGFTLLFLGKHDGAGSAFRAALDSGRRGRDPQSGRRGGVPRGRRRPGST